MQGAPFVGSIAVLGCVSGSAICVYVRSDIYFLIMSPKDKPLAWLHGEVKTPPFSKAARIEAGYLLRQLQRGETLSMPQSRPMPSIAPRCHELRINDEKETWRIVYRTDEDAIVIVEVFSKKSAKTPKRTVEVCQDRLKEYDNA